MNQNPHWKQLIWNLSLIHILPMNLAAPSMPVPLAWMTVPPPAPAAQMCIRDRYKRFGVDVSLRTVGAGTAVQETLSTLGLEKTEKAVLFAIITADSWPCIQKALRRQMRIDVPGTGIAFLVPVSSIGGQRALLFLTEHQTLELKDVYKRQLPPHRRHRLGEPGF